MKASAEKEKGGHAYTFMRIEISLRKNRIQQAPAQGDTVRRNRMEGKYLGGKACRILASGFSNKIPWETRGVLPSALLRGHRPSRILGWDVY